MDSSLRLLLLMIGVVFIAVVLWDSFRRTRFDQQRKKQLIDNHRALDGISVDLNEGIDKNTEDLPHHSTMSVAEPIAQQAIDPIPNLTAQSSDGEAAQLTPEQPAQHTTTSEVALSSARQNHFDDLTISSREVDEELTDMPSFQLEPPPATTEEAQSHSRPTTHGRAEIPFHAALGRVESKFSRLRGRKQAEPATTNESTQQPTAGAVGETVDPLSKTTRQQITDAPQDEEHIVVFHVRGKKGQKLKGEQLHRLFDELGLEFGDMNIFHHFASNENPRLRSSKQPVFSVANSHEPGTFPDAGLDAFETDGLSFFMRLPNPIDGDKAFDQLLGTVGRIAHDIDGEICDGGRQLLTKQSAHRSREIAKRFKHSGTARSSYTH